MAVAFNSSDARRTTGGTSITYSYTSSSGSDRLLVAQASTENITAPPITSVTYNGVSLSAVSGTLAEVLMYSLVAPATGANNITWNLSSYGFLFAVHSDWTGVDQSTPLGTVVNNSGTSSSPSTGSITCPANGAVWGAEFNFYTSTGPATAGSGTTLASSFRYGGSGRGAGGGYRLDTGALNWSLTGGSPAWFAQGVPINAVAAGGPTIDTNPSNALARNAEQASFSVAATTSGGALSYQWQDSSSGSFANISGATSATYFTGPTAQAMHGRLYRCVVTDSNGSTTSNAATLSIFLDGSTLHRAVRRSGRVRTHSKLWRREGWFDTLTHRAGWYSKDLILPPAAGGSTTPLTLTATAPSAAAIIRSALATRTATAPGAASVLRHISATRAASGGGSAAMVRQVVATRSASASSAALLSRLIGLARAATQGSSATLSATRLFLLTLSASIGASAAVVKAVATIKSAGAAVGAVVALLIGATRSAAGGSGAVLARVVGAMRLATAPSSATVVALRVVLMTLSATTTITATVVRQVGAVRTAAAAVLLASALKFITKDMLVAATSNASMSKSFISGGGPVWPAPADVRDGVVYGPNGNDYTGTLVVTSGGSYLRRR